MFEFLMWIGGIAAGGVFSLIGWQVKVLHSKIDQNRDRHDGLETRFDAHRLYAAETFTTKMDIQHITSTLTSQLNRIEEKIDRKQDK